ncbi:MAG: hypothetical protein ACE5K9_03735 [Candidatus Methylomirabilales bacterium]
MEMHRSIKHSLTVTIAILVSLGLAATARGIKEEDREILAGISGIQVLVDEKIGTEAERAGLTWEVLQKDVELRLRQAGVRVMTMKESLLVPGTPFLYLNVTTRENPGRHTFHLKLELMEKVRVERSPSLILYGRTWNGRGRLVTVGTGNLGSVRENVREMVDEFISEYLAANPRKP